MVGMPNSIRIRPAELFATGLLAASRRGVRVRMESVRRPEFTDQRLRELHAMANRLAAEEFDHFAVHARTNEVVHVFRRADTGEIVGFQFWGSMPASRPGGRIITGGKLRMDPAFRNRGLHLVSGLIFLLQHRIRHPRTRYYRASLASLFGFVSLTGAIAEYELFDPARTTGDAGAIRDAVLAWAERNHYEFRPETGLFFVDIFTTPETLAQYPDSFFEKPAARAYIAKNPDFRTNGCYLAFWFRITPKNVAALSKAIARKL